MSYDSNENSAALGKPVECYLFQGSQKTYRYTTSDEPVVISGNIYLPATIQRTETQIGTQDDDNADVTVTVPSDLDVVKDYAFSTQPQDLNLVIYRFHRGDDPTNDSVIYWNGLVSNLNWMGHTTEIHAPSVLSSVLSSTIPSKAYQSGCNNNLFDSNCKLSRASFTFTTTVQSVNDRSLVLAAPPPFADGFLVAGEVFLPDRDERRMILSNAATNIVFDYPFADCHPGDTVEVTAGCDHAFETCRDKFSNSVNFAAFRFVPNTNPFVYGV